MSISSTSSTSSNQPPRSAGERGGRIRSAVRGIEKNLARRLAPRLRARIRDRFARLARAPVRLAGTLGTGFRTVRGAARLVRGILRGELQVDARKPERPAPDLVTAIGIERSSLRAAAEAELGRPTRAVQVEPPPSPDAPSPAGTPPPRDTRPEHEARPGEPGEPGQPRELLSPPEPPPDPMTQPDQVRPEQRYEPVRLAEQAIEPMPMGSPAQARPAEGSPSPQVGPVTRAEVDLPLPPEEAAIDDEEHELAHERRHGRHMPETRRGA